MMPALDGVLSRLPQALLPLKCEPEQSDALGINSNNFRLSAANGSFVLKRWSNQAPTQDVRNTLSIMDWLALQQLPVPQPVALDQGSFTLATTTGVWSLFPFVEVNISQVRVTNFLLRQRVQAVSSRPGLYCPLLAYPLRVQR